MPILQLKDVDLYYEVHGSGPAFLMLSSTASDSGPWKTYQVPEFSRDHTVVIFDQRGTGRSKAKTDALTTALIAGDAAALLDHLGLDHAIVMGHSMGGRVAQMIALDHPEKVAKLILLSSGAPAASPGIPLGICKDMVEKGYERFVREHTISVGSGKGIAAHPERVEEFLSARMASLVPLETYLRYVIARQAHDTSGRLKEITVPVLVMVGEEEGHSLSDHTHFDTARRYATELPDAELVVIPGQGHFYPFYDPETTHREIRAFLERR